MDQQQIINQVTHQLKQLKNDSQTPAGQAKPVEPELVQAINESFESLRVNYHNQFLKAYPDIETLNFAKRLWLNHLQEFDANQVRLATQQVMKNSDFLPTIHGFLKAINDASLYGLPDVHSAYMEACRAPQPKSEFSWTHPAVYFAGLATDWFFMATEKEERVFPVFKRNYEILCQRVAKGEELEMPVHKALPQEVTIPLGKKENLSNLKKLRESMGL